MSNKVPYQHNVAKKVALSIVAAGIFTIMLSAGLRLSLVNKENLSNIEVRLDAVARAAAPQIKDALQKRDSASLNSLMEQLVATANVHEAVLTYRVDAHEKVLRDQHRHGELPSWPVQASRTLPLASSDGQAQLEVTAIESFFSPNTMRELTRNILVETLIVVVLALSMLFLLRYFVFRHIFRIADYLGARSSENLHEALILSRSPTASSRSDEFDQVVDSIEKMRKTLIHDMEQKRAIEMALSEEKEQQMETLRLINEAKAANRAKSEFIATMSHEIRTPLNGVVGMVEMLRDTPLNDNQKHYLDILYRSGESLLEIINDILDYSKIESGRMLLEAIHFDLEELIDNCFKLFGATANKREIELISNILPDTPTHLIGDPTRLRQVIINLVGNAFKFTSAGFIILKVSSVDNSKISGDQDIELKFSVQDSGIGIPKVDQSHLFEAFRQADSSTTRKFGGSGLGLAICKQLAELMGGEIGIDSDEGKGSTFWFTSKLKANPQEFITNPPSCSLALSSKRLLSINLSRVLIDNIDSQIASWNLHHEHAKTVEEANLFDAKNAPRYNFVLINHRHSDERSADIRSDEAPPNNKSSDGFHLAKRLRSLDAYAMVPILLLTNQQASSFTQEKLFAVTSIVPRPVAVQNLKNVLISQGYGTQLNPLMPQNSFKTVNQELKVLVAEDNPVNQMVIEGLLSKFSIVPDFADNGREAVEMFFDPEKQYDLILMDCEMPQMNGFEATKKIRQQEKDRAISSTPIIALTAHVEASHRRQVYDCGMNHFLSKPVTIDKLNEALNSVGLGA